MAAVPERVRDWILLVVVLVLGAFAFVGWLALRGIRRLVRED